MIPVVFFGTNAFAAQTLEGLINSSFVEVVLVITQPDKRVGRKQVLESPAVKVLAEKHGICVEQPTSLQDYRLPVTAANVGILEKYGLMIPDEIINAFPLGIVNIHPSLLPTYRGPSPFQTALMNGETETGVTIMKLVQKMDAGPLLAQRVVPIEPDETALDLEKKLAAVGIDLLLETLPLYIDGSLKQREQDESSVTYSHLLTRDTGKIDWHKPAQEIYNLYRGLTPWPGMWTVFREQRLKLLEVRPSLKGFTPGAVSVEDGTIFIGCGGGSLEVLSLQLEGKKPMDPKTFLNGYNAFAHATLE
jgi:methionyl-tRNA formyltransferase